MRLDSVFPARSATRRRAAPGIGYSRFVALAKRVLPAIAVGLLLLIAVWPRFVTMFERMRFRAPPIDLSEARDLRMVSVRYTGIDRENRPFVVTADVARQTPKVDDLISLDNPKADMKTASGGWIELGAYTGIYQPQPQLLDLFGDVALYQDKGNEFHSDSARVDMAKGTAEGSDSVTGQGPFGTVVAQGYRILDRGDIVIFTGRTHLVIAPREKAPQ
jgi:lipopolysaccharide export system protein LptC